MVNHCVFVDECGYNIWTARNQCKEEPESETGLTDKYAGKEGVMLP